MKRTLFCAVLAFSASPAMAQQVAGIDRPATTAAELRVPLAPGVDRPVTADRPELVARPDRPERIDRPDRPGGPDQQAYAQALRNAYQRAKNAVANGASPERGRTKLQEFKQQLRERWNATH